jgi:hypothetical protein
MTKTFFAKMGDLMHPLSMTKDCSWKVDLYKLFMKNDDEGSASLVFKLFAFVSKYIIYKLS